MVTEAKFIILNGERPGSSKGSKIREFARCSLGKYGYTPN
jgi:hypothetical protein